MDCRTEKTPQSNAEYFNAFTRKVAAERIPLTGSIELTHRCNLSCVHCYLGRGDQGGRGGRGPENAPMRARELTTANVLRLIDEATEAGCLFLLLTGGEPLLRDDFDTIYRHARLSGLVVTVFTNGTLITERTVELFKELPPHSVEISLYGATAETYERITGVRGSFKRCIQGIRALADGKVHITLKTVLLSLNKDELSEMERISEGFGAKFRFDPAISACMDGDQSPIGLRVPASECVELEFSDPERFDAWRKFYENSKLSPLSDRLYHCGAGLNNFNIDPYGNLTPCIMVSSVSHDISGGGFMEGWNGTIPDIRKKKLRADSPCLDCTKKNICGYCPPFFGLENGEEDASSEFTCAVGHHRVKALSGNNALS